MTDYDIRLTLRPEKSEASMVSLAMRNRWDMRVMGNRNADVFTNVWVTSAGVSVHYVEDPLTGTPFVTLRGAGSDEAAELIKTSCDVWEFPEAVQALATATDRDDRLRAAYAAAFTAPDQPVEELVILFRAMAADSDPGIRQAVIVSSAYTPWPPLVDIVRHLAVNDSVDHVRENARVLLEGMRIHGDTNERDKR
ncbi:hypothetical protein ACFQ60_09385 [Streptomyces zhihengii]|uniref:HEAT repeat domain-containing protein n=1 Tax=Streptomyces zhihengii TaxID=1818004 RepID=A0ABS2UZY3_9ACTN|nr:hypothetical protein [Streptomyces zhihengii]MBM9623151.1 hypothetical protein [Streptomyces zhihengii]